MMIKKIRSFGQEGALYVDRGLVLKNGCKLIYIHFKLYYFFERAGIISNLKTPTINEISVNASQITPAIENTL